MKRSQTKFHVDTMTDSYWTIESESTLGVVVLDVNVCQCRTSVTSGDFLTLDISLVRLE